MSHLNAPATKYLDIRCCCCHTPLVDSISTNFGIGPICRENNGFVVEVDEATRREGNKLIHFIAHKRLGNDVDAAAERLGELGFTVLADHIKERLATSAKLAAESGITISVEGSRLVLTTPYRRGRADEFKAAMRSIPGRKWNGKANTFPADAKSAVWALLCEFFPGKYGIGPKGVFGMPTQKMLDRARERQAEAEAADRERQAA